jgi:adenylate cyclase
MTSPSATAPALPAAASRSGSPLVRAARLASGIVLMLFVTSHLLNHAVGIFGIEAMGVVQHWRIDVWRSWPGTVLLYGAATVHVILSLRRILQRSTWRMPLIEMMQIVLGLMIPLLLVDHVIATRVMSSRIDFDDSYGNLLRIMWPGLAISQSILLLVVWTHGVIGIYFVVTIKPWFRAFRIAFILTAVIVPLMAISGFISAGREAALVKDPPITFSDLHFQVFNAAKSNSMMVIYAIAAVLAASLLLRVIMLRRSRMVSVRFAGHGPLRSPKGLTLLEMSRLHRLPHASSCGGKGRCATCRVMVIGGGDKLAPPNAIEQRTLQRIRAPLQVRLACQIEPTEALIVRTLLPTGEQGKARLWHSKPLEWGEERTLTVLIADVRGFSSLARFQPPNDLVLLLNRIVEEMSQAVERRGGRVALIETDGIMAVFGLEGSQSAAARAAIEAAADILHAIDHVNTDAGLAVSQPIRVGVGVHTGPVVATDIGDPERGFQLAVIGTPVVVADRLEEATKEHAADCLVSVVTMEAAGLGGRTGRTVHIAYKNGDATIAAAVFGDGALLRTMLGRRDTGASEASPAPLAGAAAPGQG